MMAKNKLCVGRVHAANGGVFGLFGTKSHIVEARYKRSTGARTNQEQTCGSYTSGRREIVELLRHRSRPYLFSNTIAPVLEVGAITAVELAEQGEEMRAVDIFAAAWGSLN